MKKLLLAIIVLANAGCPAPQPQYQAPAPVAQLPNAPILLASASQITRITNDPHEERWIDIDKETQRLLYTVVDRSDRRNTLFKSFMIYLARAGRVPLGSGDVAQPAWVPGGDDYVATVLTNGQWRLAKKNVRAPKTTFVSSMTDSAINSPTVSPDGTMIAFEVKDGSGQIATVMTGGSEYTLYGEGHTPQWRPDGQALVYIYRDQVYELDLSTGTRTQLTYNTTKLIHRDPVYNSDGSWIAFAAAASRGGAPNLWVMRNDGSSRTKLSNGIGEWKPIWPSTGHIYFIARTRTGNDIWRITPQL